MCIAIVKFKGIDIPEEHLYNGFQNNKDGAGFACINHEGMFVIHKSMTYEGFIDVYKETVKNYGETSDFLIHFRITSKGDTTIDNCHPFIVDEERVIIHNGTLWNIDIDKKDKRSDTKVFAEDWLSQLPEEWEDNPILVLMLEDFLNTSKVAMMHRTKGIYIFNAEKGVFVDGNWYSNDSYKKRTYPIVVGFDNKKDRHTNYKEYSYYNKQWIPCNICGEYDTTVNMISMHSDHPNQMWCYDCFGKSDICELCGKRYNEKNIDDYYSAEDDDLVSICDNCVPFIQDTDLKKVETEENKEGETNEMHSL